MENEYLVSFKETRFLERWLLETSLFNSVLALVFQLMSPQKTAFFLFLRRASASQVRHVYRLQNNFS